MELRVNMWHGQSAWASLSIMSVTGNSVIAHPPHKPFTHTHINKHTHKPYTGTHTHRLTQAHESTHPHVHTLARSVPLSPFRSLSSSIMKRHVFYILQIIPYVIYGSGALLQYTFGKSNPNNMANGNLDKGTKGSNNTAMHSFYNLTGHFRGVC